VLVKHTYAGNEIGLKDLETIFGTYFFRSILNEKLGQSLLSWLKSNQRNEWNFNLSSSSTVDLG
jgi:hypothetical protein